MKIRPLSDFYPYCDICGEKITDEEFLSTGKENFHEDCLDRVNTDTYAENQRMGDEHEYI